MLKHEGFLFVLLLFLALYQPFVEVVLLSGQYAAAAVHEVWFGTFPANTPGFRSIFPGFSVGFI